MASVLEEDSPPLSEMLDLDAFREVCKSFSELYGLGIKVFDTAGKKIADVRAGASDHCGYLFSVHPTQVMCTKLVGDIRITDVAQASKQIECFSGLRYKILPLEYDGSLLGRVIFGPYRPPEVTESPAALRQHAAQGLDHAKLSGFLRAVPQAAEAAVDKILHHVRNVLDVIIHNSYKTHLTSRVHIASIAGAFGDLERTNKALQQANDRLQELDRLKSNFIATVSHELRTPLTSVIGYSEMLLEGMAGEMNQEQRDYVSTILEKGESLLVLIGQILDLSRIESGNVVIHRQPTSIKDILGLSLSDVVPQAKKRDLKLEATVTPDVDKISVDPDKIRRIVTNLLSNAVKFTPAGGKVTVAVDHTEDVPAGDTRLDIFQPERNRFLRIRVTDTGIGIPQDKLGQIFDAFFQVDNSSTREFGGTGLGLAIVKNFVSAHGGRVTVESKVGEGSSFIVKLPYVYDAPVGAAGVDGLATGS